jgi:3-oxoacyl-[acyl-carrier protein] reductase
MDLAAAADYSLDISDAAAVERALAAMGPIDILINSAGVIGPNKPLWQTTAAEWQRVFDVNVFGLVNVTRAVVPGMVERGWGRIVSMASMAGKDGNPNLAAYSASKAAVIGLTKSLGKELAKTGVIANAIAPAVIETPMNATTSPEVLAHITSLIPMGRVGQADEVAALVSWLSSDEVSFSTGAVYDISGGRATY